MDRLTLRCKNCFWIVSGDAARVDPAEAADEGPEQERNRGQWNQARQAQNDWERAAKKFTSANEPAGAGFVQCAIGCAMAIHFEPDPEHGLDPATSKPIQ